MQNFKTNDMNYSTIFSLIFATSIILGGCQGSTSEEDTTTEEGTEETEQSSGYIDAVEAASEHYTLLSEEGPVRVIEMRLPAGARDNKHSHNHETVYFISGGSVQIYVDGDTVSAEIPDGHVMHHEPWTHSVENTGDGPIRAIIFEQMEVVPTQQMEGYVDAASAAADHYSTLSKDGNVRVVHMTLGPGERDNTHSHYNETVYFISGGKANIHVGDEVVEADIPDGHVMHHDPWTHSVENIGDTEIEAIIFERIPVTE